jgi:serine/threonine-protein kinase
VCDGRSIALIMEYVEGECLQRMLERGGLPLHTSVDYAGQVLDALAYAHRMGVVHRDVSPANIIITPEGTAKLTDFGLARAATDLSLTATGVAMGSPWYMSPEQVRASGELDARTDIYAMGAVLYEMLTGRKLFDADGSFAVMRAQVEAVPKPPSAHNPEVPTALDKVVARALAKDPAARFQSAGEFRLALEAAVERMRSSGAAANSEPASRRIKRYAARAATFRPALRLGRVRTSRAAILLVLASAALAAVFCTVLLWPKAERVAVQEHVLRDAVASKPAPVTEPAPPQVVDVVGPEFPLEAAKPAPRPAASSARSARRSGKPDQSLAARVSGRVVEPPAAMPPPNEPPGVPAAPPETPALKPNEAEAPETPPVSVASKTSAELEDAAQTHEEAKPPKAGNRFIRALGKLNPFRKGAKNDSADPAEASTKKD